MALYLDYIPCLIFQHSWFISIHALSQYMKMALKYIYIVQYINNARYRCTDFPAYKLYQDSNYDRGYTIGFIINSRLLIIHSGKLHSGFPRKQEMFAYIIRTHPSFIFQFQLMLMCLKCKFTFTKEFYHISQERSGGGPVFLMIMEIPNQVTSANSQNLLGNKMPCIVPSVYIQS